MPGPRYRRALRAKQSQPTQTFINTYILPECVMKQTGTSELEKIRSYFISIIDMIIHYETFQESTKQLQSILQSIETKVQYFKLLELVEENLLSVAINISDNVNPKLIQTRIEYIQSIIQTMPPICQECGPITELILDLIQSIIESVNLSKVSSTIHSIQTYLNETYGNQSYYDTIQCNLLNIIHTIANGTNTKLIEYRIDYVKELITNMPI